ncbi:hypothetical protein FQR65_LT09469 [Abscondita terminalis]|nr:hypothetical protein FQR65_LT09469 [Abscondita terminalis]
MHETLFMAVSNNQTLKSNSGTSLHHCKPYHDKLCYLTRFDSDAIYGPQCAYKMYTGATVEELSQHCSFRCHASQSMLISEIDSNTFIITHPKRETYILCENKKLAIEKNNYNQPGALQIKLPCQCSLIVNTKEVISPRFPCSSNGINDPEFIHVLPATWSKLKTYVIKSAKHEIVFNNTSECIDNNWTTTVPHLNLSTTSIIGQLKESLEFAIANTPNSLYSFQSDTTFYVWNVILSLLCIYLFSKVNQQGGALVALIHPVVTLETDEEEVKTLTYVSSISLCIFVLVMLCTMLICCVKQWIIMSKSKKRAETRRFSSARSIFERSKSTGEERAVELETLSRRNIFVVNPSEQNPSQPVAGCSTKIDENVTTEGRYQGVDDLIVELKTNQNNENEEEGQGLVNDPDADHVTILNLLIQTRLKYGKGIHDLFHLCSKQKIKKIERDNIIVYSPPEEHINVPSLPPLPDEGSEMHKKMVSNLTTLKQQIRIMNIINKNNTCAIAQLMDKL